MTLDTSYIFGPQPGDETDHWFQFLYDGSTGAEVVGDALALHVIDNRRGDLDLETNGRVVTRLGPGSIDPTAGTTLTVNTNDDIDDGILTQLSLREAIIQANLLPGKDLIAFDIPGDGPHTIQPTSPLPTIKTPVIIDGYTEPGAVPATFDATATMMIEIDGSLAGSTDGLVLTSGGSTVRGLVVNRFQSDGVGRFGTQILVNSGSDNIIEGNYLGTDVAGAASYYMPGYANIQRYGIVLQETVAQGGTNTIIGGIHPAARNIVSGFAGAGVLAFGESATGIQIIGNYVGTDATGSQALGNDTGVNFESESHHNYIGGTEPGAGNLISGNLGYGVVIGSGGRSPVANTVQGNTIGTDLSGTVALPNGMGGIQLLAAERTAVGGSDPGAGNVISGNQGDGINITVGELASVGTLIQGNWIGTARDGSEILGNTGHGISLAGFDSRVGGIEPGEGNVIAHNGGSGVIIGPTFSFASPAIRGELNSVLGNSIYHNGGLGIDLSAILPSSDGTTPNDPADGASWPPPTFSVLNAVRNGQFIDVSGTLSAAAGNQLPSETVVHRQSGNRLAVGPDDRR